MIRILATLSIPKREIRFVYGTSTGPGGQHVNKVATKATLLFHVLESCTLTETQQTKILSALPPQSRYVP